MKPPRGEQPVRVAAIDVGSNGIRLLVGAVQPGGEIVEIERHREAVRLGHDAFGTGRFSEETIASAVTSMRRISARLAPPGAVHTCAVATSAVRTAVNGQALLDAIRTDAGIDVRRLDAAEEAALVADAVATTVDWEGRTAALIDIGGGSVECSLFAGRRHVVTRSLPLGPVRLLRQLQAEGAGESDVSRLIRPVLENLDRLSPGGSDASRPDLAVATGGSPEWLARRLVPTTGTAADVLRLAVEPLRHVGGELRALTVPERIERFDLPPDRADLIVLAIEVLAAMLESLGLSEAIVPCVGLLDGLLLQAVREVHEGPPRPVPSASTDPHER